MSDPVKIIECPRDAWQGLQGRIPSDLKVDYLKALISTGFKHIDAASFVSPKAVPQMSDSEAVLKDLDPPDDVEITGIVVNEKGAQRAINTQAVTTLGFPYSISPTFLRNNQRQTPEESLDELEKIQNKADDAGLDMVVYISMAFGNPYGDSWAAEKVLAAYAAGCRRFDSAIGGLGGCPFAQDALVGNIPTERLLDALQQAGAQLPPLKPLETLLRASAEIGTRYSASHAAD